MRSALGPFVFAVLLAGCAGEGRLHQVSPADTSETVQEFVPRTDTTEVAAAPTALDGDEDLAIRVPGGSPRKVDITAESMWSVSYLYQTECCSPIWAALLPADFKVDIEGTCAPTKEPADRYVLTSYISLGFRDNEPGEYVLHVYSESKDLGIYLNGASYYDDEPKKVESTPSSMDIQREYPGIDNRGGAPLEIRFQTEAKDLALARVELTFSVSGFTRVGESSAGVLAMAGDSTCARDAMVLAPTQAHATTLEGYWFGASLWVQGNETLAWDGHYEATAGEFVNVQAAMTVVRYESP